MCALARILLVIGTATLLLSGCRTAPMPHAPPQGDSLARTALEQLGSPYRFGGSTRRGFDCSGLVLYVHEREGLTVPRTAADQQRAAQPVSLDTLAPGDLIFFRIDARKVDHVGIYVGDDRFVHAPRSARPVSLERLSEPYYRDRLAGAGRFWVRRE
jgi:murein DD-endopeptidase